MRAYIIRDIPLSLSSTEALASTPEFNGQTNVALENLKLKPVLDTPQQRVNCSKLEAHINSYAAAHGFGESVKRRSDGTQKTESIKWNISVSVHCDKLLPSIILLSGKMFFVLYNVAFPNEVSVKLTMKEYAFDDLVGNKSKMSDSTFSTNEMMIKFVKSASGEMIGFCQDQSTTKIMSEEQYYVASQGTEDADKWKRLKGKCTMELTLHNFLESCPRTVVNCQNVLTETVGKDCTIITVGGKQISCHRSFLAANSPVLKATLQRDARSRKIEMADVSEEGARAFLDYVYWRNLDKPMKVASVGFELFSIAEKYDMASLKADMKALFVGMSSCWKIEFEMKRYFFAGKLADGKELKRQALEVLKSNFADVMNSDCYKNLFREDPEGAMEICNDLINLSGPPPSPAEKVTAPSNSQNALHLDNPIVGRGSASNPKS